MINYCDKVKHGFSYMRGNYMLSAYPIGYQFHEGFWNVRYSEDFQIFQGINGLIRFKNLVKDEIIAHNKPMCYNRVDIVFNKEYVFLVKTDLNDHYVYIMAVLTRKNIPGYKPQELLEASYSHKPGDKPELINRVKPIDQTRYSMHPSITPRQAEANLEWALLYFTA